MNCFALISILLLTFIGQIYGRIVSFSLLTFGSQVTVTINGVVYPMQPVDNYSHVYSASTMLPEEAVTYSYTVDGVPEGFERTLEPGALTTHIEFLGRKNTLDPLKGMGYPPDKPTWDRSIGKTPVFDDSYIPTVILDCNRDFIITPPDNFTLSRFTLVLQDEIFTETDVLTKTQNRYEDKFQFRVKLQNKIHKRKVFKFRANAADPTFFRQSIYGDMAYAVGNPVHNQIVVRVYMSDGSPVGLYLMIEVSSSNSFIKTQFYGNEGTGRVNVPETGLGYCIEGSTGADFNRNANFSNFWVKPGENNAKVLDLTDAMHQVDVNNLESVQKFSKEWLDLDSFFRALALEYLTGDWDAYWMRTCNFVIYDAPEESSPTNTKFWFIDQDFDLTFGIGLSSKVNLVGDAFPTQSYKTLVDRTWGVGSRDPMNREAIDVFLRGGITKDMFENHLIDIVKHVFNPVATGRRLDEYVRRYKEEIEWDYAIKRIHVGLYPDRPHHVWTVQDFLDNLESTPKNSVPWGLKQWISMRAQAVANEFGFEWDEQPLDPVVKNLTAIALLDTYDEDKKKKSKNMTNANTSDSIQKVTLSITFVLVFLSSLLMSISM